MKFIKYLKNFDFIIVIHNKVLCVLWWVQLSAVVELIV